MNRLMVSLLLVCSFLPAQAADISEVGIQTQQDDQALCIQQRTNQCVDKCQDNDDSNCAQLCRENAKNECRQAGE